MMAPLHPYLQTWGQGFRLGLGVFDAMLHAITILYV